MSTRVDIRQVIDAFNQSSYFPFKLDRNGANFGNFTLALAVNKWSNNSFEAKSFQGYSRTVEVKTQHRSTVTSVSASPDATPGSKLTISTGCVDGFGSPNVSASIPLPKEFRDVTMLIDLTKDVQDVKLSDAFGNVSYKLQMKGSGKASVTSENTIYQGSFEAVACLKGPVVIAGQGGQQGFQGNIEELARIASGQIQKPLYYDAGRNALCWKVTGFADFLLENISVVRAN